MTLQEFVQFVQKIRAGEMIVPGSLIDPDETSWEEALRLVRAEIG